MRRYQALIRLYADNKKKVLFKFIAWNLWAKNKNQANLIARLEGKKLRSMHESIKKFTWEIVSK